MTAPPPTTAISTPATGRSNRESRKIAAQWLIGAAEARGIRLSDWTLGVGVRALVTGDPRFVNDDAFFAWLMEQFPGGRKPRVAKDHRLRTTPL